MKVYVKVKTTIDKMALSTRLAMRGCLLQQNLGKKWIHSTSSMTALQTVSPKEKQTFWDKNKRLGRPISPHLTIYAPQITWLMSITHRATGCFQSAVLSGVGLTAVFTHHQFPYAVELLQQAQFGGVLLFGAKFIVAWPVTFHLLNGIRHLTWDLGYGFKLPDLYKTGYAVLGLSLVSAALVAML